MRHLTPDELVDAVEGTLAPDRQSHVEQCFTCRDEAARLTMILREARAAEVPEPSPLFWDRLSSRVRAAIAEGETAPVGWAPAWLRWNVLVPLGALALLVLALTMAIPREPVAPLTVDATPAATDPGDLATDVATLGGPAWAMLSEIVGPVAVEHAREAGIVVQPGDVERAALELNAAEQRELRRLLTEETEIGTLQ